MAVYTSLHPWTKHYSYIYVTQGIVVNLLQIWLFLFFYKVWNETTTIITTGWIRWTLKNVYRTIFSVYFLWNKFMKELVILCRKVYNLPIYRCYITQIVLFLCHIKCSWWNILRECKNKNINYINLNEKFVLIRYRRIWECS